MCLPRVTDRRLCSTYTAFGWILHIFLYWARDAPFSCILQTQQRSSPSNNSCSFMTFQLDCNYGYQSRLAIPSVLLLGLHWVATRPTAFAVVTLLRPSKLEHSKSCSPVRAYLLPRAPLKVNYWLFHVWIGPQIKFGMTFIRQAANGGCPSRGRSVYFAVGR